MDVTALKTAIMTAYNANSDLATALTGGLHWRKMRQDPAAGDYPYAVYFIVSELPIYTFTEVSEVTVIQFSIFDHDPDDINNDTMLNDAAKKLMVCFDFVVLSTSGYTSVVMIRELGREVPTPAGDDVLHYAVDYRIRIQKSR